MTVRRMISKPFFSLWILVVCSVSNIFCQVELPKVVIKNSLYGNALKIYSEPYSKHGIAILYSTPSVNTIHKEWQPVHAYPIKKSFRGGFEVKQNERAQRFFRLEFWDMEIDPNMIWIPPGDYLMGSPGSELPRSKDEGPQCLKAVTHGLWVNKFEVTQEEYIELMGNNPSKAYNELAGSLTVKLPVESVTWDEANEYCRRLNERELKANRLPPGYEYRLPTEVEWEYVARAGTNQAYSYGNLVDHLSEYGWWRKNAGDAPMPVGQLKPNPWGLYDIHGNVFEWCLDDYKAYEGGASILSSDLEGLNYKVTRGGAFYCPSSILRSACRNHPQIADYRNWLTGLRVFLAPKRPARR